VTDTATVTYAYNGEGRRVEKSTGQETIYYLYEYDKVVLEVDGTGDQVARNLYGINLLMRDVDEDSYYYVYNGHADVTALINANTGSVDATYYYDPFGNILESTGNVNNNITYAGYQYDEETELYYLNARMYDPKVARFLQEDTYRGDPNDPLSLNLYAYTANNPITYYDPTGHYYVFGMHVSEYWEQQRQMQKRNSSRQGMPSDLWNKVSVSNNAANSNSKKNIENIILFPGMVIDKSLLGSGPVGDFTNLKVPTVEGILARIPSNAIDVGVKPDPSGAMEGFQFKWTDSEGITWRVRAHGKDISAPKGSNASEGWVFRVQKFGGGYGKWFLGEDGTWYKANVGNPRSPEYNEKAANKTHMRMKDPNDRDNDPPASGGSSGGTTGITSSDSQSKSQVKNKQGFVGVHPEHVVDDGGFIRDKENNIVGNWIWEKGYAAYYNEYFGGYFCPTMPLNPTAPKLPIFKPMPIFKPILVP
jgi:RHS repeat-associated protein